MAGTGGSAIRRSIGTTVFKAAGVPEVLGVHGVGVDLSVAGGDCVRAAVGAVTRIGFGIVIGAAYA